MTSELLSVIDQYVEGAITLEQLEDWLVARLVTLFRLPLSEPQATELVAAVELGLAEMSTGTRTEDEFRSLLRALLQRSQIIPLSYPAESPVTRATSSNETVLTGVSTAPDRVFSLAWSH